METSLPLKINRNYNEKIVKINALPGDMLLCCLVSSYESQT